MTGPVRANGVRLAGVLAGVASAAAAVVVASPPAVAAVAGPPAAAVAQDATSGPQPTPAAHVILRITDPRITESSGLARSMRHPGVLWTMEDSGNAPRLYAIGPDGRTRATLTLAVDSRDWEAMSTGPGDTLWVGDIGDNSASRDVGILVHRLPEPARLVNATVHPTSYRLVYPDGPHDAEAMVVDPAGRVWIATKELLGGGLYRTPAPPRAGERTVLERVGEVPSIVTDGTLLPDGRMVLRTYGRAYVYVGPGGALLQSFALPRQEQGESVAPAQSGDALVVGSEGADSPVWLVQVPPAGASTAHASTSASAGTGASSSGAGPVATGSPADATPTAPTGAAAGTRDPLPVVPLAVGGAALAAVLAVVLALVRRR